MTHITHSARSSFTLGAHFRRAVGWLDRIPYSALAVPLRVAVATVFWHSAMAKLANLETAFELFREEYRLPLLPPEVAVYLAVSVELTAPVLLLLGLATRLAALVLLCMTAVIQLFVYPQAWPTHIQWGAMLLVLLARGAGTLSADWLIRRHAMCTGEQ
ncbi:MULTISPECIES: DoxX family protein [Cupriavidus]|uniref:DoxX family protein n=1 Tax=Cupriavidus oxalaticus TaxID=96344 RepID=A0A4P7L5Z4_9BURK|nr:MULTISPECIES: DoxX family protein [Cupriavidus]MBF6990314.1 DoxX family protein [Cupriavidus sp. IK-TO18]QBY50575.1 DoxX family protein [Cupriavidus oxalaticus]TDF64216.1 DoxX family protein [Cupriavidus sp. L7L]